VTTNQIHADGQRNFIDISVSEVVVDLAESGPLAMGSKVEVYFRYDAPPALSSSTRIVR
jgi:hypothetical protein